jgi:hypothetical protein
VGGGGGGRGPPPGGARLGTSRQWQESRGLKGGNGHGQNRKERKGRERREGVYNVESGSCICCSGYAGGGDDA